MKQPLAASLHRYCRSGLLSIFIALATPLVANAQGYTVANLGTLGGSTIQAYQINAAGQAIGIATTAGNAQTHAFLYSGGVLHDLGTFGGTYSEPTRLTDSGRVIGYAKTAGDAGFHAFLYSEGVMYDLGTLGGSVSYPTWINSAGQVVGYSTLPGDTTYHAFLWSGGVMVDLGTLPGGVNSRAMSINNSGQVVGISSTAGGNHVCTVNGGGDSFPAGPGGPEPGSSQQGCRAFLYSAGTMQDLGVFYPGVPGFDFSSAFAISDAGDVIGQSYIPYAPQAFLYRAGQLIDLGRPSGCCSFPIATNAVGDVLVGATGGPAFIWSNGTSRVLSDLGGNGGASCVSYTGPIPCHGWNASGQLVGNTNLSDGSHGWIFSGGIMTDLGSLSGLDTFARAINDLGFVVGGSDVLCGGGFHCTHPIVYKDGVMTDLNGLLPAADRSYAIDINNAGQILVHSAAAFILTPATPPFVFTGFFQPVDNLPVLNAAKAGSAIPVKFSLGGDKGINIFAAGYPKSQTIACDSTAPVDGIEQTVSAGQSGLSYDPATGQYSYVWKTENAWAGTCRQLVMRLNDNSSHSANFKFK